MAPGLVCLPRRTITFNYKMKHELISHLAMATKLDGDFFGSISLT